MNVTFFMYMFMVQKQLQFSLLCVMLGEHGSSRCNALRVLAIRATNFTATLHIHLCFAVLATQVRLRCLILFVKKRSLLHSSNLQAKTKHVETKVFS